jgi:hypothetical protein
VLQRLPQRQRPLQVAPPPPPRPPPSTPQTGTHQGGQAQWPRTSTRHTGVHAVRNQQPAAAAAVE